MPTIDERKITLTETGRQTVEHDVDCVTDQLTLVAGFSVQIRTTITSGGSAFNGELARHEVRIKQGTSTKATFLWDSRSVWDGDPVTTTWSTRERSHTSNPAHAGDVEFVMPTSAVVWSAPFTLDTDWTHTVSVAGISLDSNYTAKVTGQLDGGNVKFILKFRVGETGAVKFSAEINVSHVSRRLTAVKGELLPAPDVSSAAGAGARTRKARKKKG